MEWRVADFNSLAITEFPKSHELSDVKMSQCNYEKSVTSAELFILKMVGSLWILFRRAENPSVSLYFVKLLSGKPCQLVLRHLGNLYLPAPGR